MRHCAGVGLVLGQLVAIMSASATSALAQPSPIIDGLWKDQVQAICAPRLPADDVPAAFISANRDAALRLTYGPSDVLVLDAGMSGGVTVGATYLVRRAFPVVSPDRADRVAFQGEGTAGWVRVTAVDEGFALAVPVYACREFVRGDALYPYEAPEALVGQPGSPDFEHPARVMFGDEGRTAGSQQQLMVVDRGSDAGLVVGQWLTLFRRTFGASGPVSEIAQGVVVGLRPETATIRIEASRDAVYVGDFAAPHARR